MKKVLSILLLVLVSFSIVGCSDNRTAEEKMQDEIEDNGFDITMDGSYINFENEDEEMELSIYFFAETAADINISLEQEEYSFLYSVEEDNVLPLDGVKTEKVLENVSDAIGYSTAEIADFANWYYEQNK